MKHIKDILVEVKDARNENFSNNDPTFQKYGWVKMPKMILFNKGISLGAKVVYGILLGYSWEPKSYCFPSQKLIAEALNVSERTLRGYIKELQKIGIVEIIHRGFNKTNLYKVKVRQEDFKRKYQKGTILI